MLRNVIWEEMKTAKTYNVCCLRYASQKRQKNKKIRLIIIALVIAGIACSILFSTYGIFCAIIGVVFAYHHMQNEDELHEIDEFSIFYEDVFKKLSSIWEQIETNQELFDVDNHVNMILQDLAQKKVRLNQLFESITEKEKCEIEKEVDIFMRSRFYE